MRDPRRDRVERHEPADDEHGERDRGDVHEREVGKDRAAEGDVADHDEEAEDGEKIEEPLRDDDADGARQRQAEASLHEVAAIEVAELRRDEAVHEPAEQQDLEEVAAADPHAALP